MKIRIAMLLAVSFFGLPSLHGQEIRLRSYNQEISQDNGCVKRGEEYLTWVRANNHSEDSLWVDPSDNGAFFTQKWEDSCPEGLTNNNAGERYQSWGISANGVTPNGQESGWQWNTDVYSEWSREILPFGYYWQIIPLEHCKYTNMTVQTNNGDLVTTNIYRYSGDTRIELLTGGESNSTKQALFELTVEATEFFNIVIPPPWLSALGKTATRKPEDTNSGVIYKKLADNQIVDATVSAPTACYTYKAWAAKAYLLLVDGGEWGDDVTDQTTVIWAGEKVALDCRLSDPFVEITSYDWSVPGTHIGGWEISPNSTNGQVLPVFPLFHVSTNAVTFYPVAEGTITVSCTVQVGGETMTASTTYEVRKPRAWWRVWPKGPHGVEVTTHGTPIPGSEGLYHLTTGHATSADDSGVRYDYRITDLAGYTNAFDCYFGQWLTANDKGNVELPGKPFKSWWTWEQGLDTTPGFEWWYSRWANQVDSLVPANDTPQTSLPNTIRYYTETNAFISILFWQSNRGRHSIPVPVSRADWGWAGEAKKIQGTQPPVWYLYSRTQPTLTYGYDWNWHPSWDHRMNTPPASANTNNFYYPEPGY